MPEGRVEGYSVPRLADQGTGHHLAGCQVPKHTIAIRNSPDITFVVYPNQNVPSKTMAKKTINKNSSLIINDKRGEL